MSASLFIRSSSLAIPCWDQWSWCWLPVNLALMETIPFPYKRILWICSSVSCYYTCPTQHLYLQNSIDLERFVNEYSLWLFKVQTDIKTIFSSRSVVYMNIYKSSSYSSPWKCNLMCRFGHWKEGKLSIGEKHGTLPMNTVNSSSSCTEKYKYIKTVQKDSLNNCYWQVARLFFFWIHILELFNSSLIPHSLDISNAGWCLLL